ncbi:MAG: efflux RND transporter periplasmic adaptor subunit [Kiritimatiellae bacterium]|nr:efflux RND transporter periplasmic adaptor subunit [Kiritimatiellia bacterium]MDD5521120.1 efflux RND transporter periplasmic adaptor subunit [Kiritimatiellia bacterium]
MKTKLRKILIIAIVVIVLIMVTRKQTGLNSESINISGNIEITDAELSFRIPGRLEARLVSEGESVKSGQMVAKLDSSDLAQEVAMRKAEESATAAFLAELEAGSRPEEIAQAEAVFDLCNSEEKRLQSDFARQKELFEKKVISTREFEVAETALTSAKAKTREVEAHLNLLKKGPRVEQINAAKARREQTKQALTLAKIRLGYATLTSPMSGLVLSDHVESGEYVVPGTAIVTVGDMEHAWMRGYINESDLGRVKVGQPAKITTDTWPGKTYEGKISFISAEAEFTPKNVQTAKERTKLVYRIKIDIPNPLMELKPGMPADAVIFTTRKGDKKTSK